MLNYYFLTTLRPLEKDMTLPISSQELFHKASFFIDNNTKDNLNYLMQYKNLSKDINSTFIENLINFYDTNLSDIKDDNLFNKLQIAYWYKLANNNNSKILKTYGAKLFNLYCKIDEFYSKDHEKFACFIKDQEIDNFIKNILEKISLKQGIKAQLLIEDYCWNILQENSSYDPFSWEELYIYFLKTQIIERKQSYLKTNKEEILSSLIAKGSYASTN